MNRLNLTVLASTAAALAALLVAVVPARAATTSSTVTVKATVAPKCLMNSPTLDFGAYDPTAGSPKDVSTTLTVNCTKNAAFTIGLDQGLNGPARNMKDAAGPDLLNYELYTDVAGGTVWTTLAGTGTKAGTGNGLAAGLPVTIFGRIF